MIHYFTVKIVRVTADGYNSRDPLRTTIVAYGRERVNIQVIRTKNQI